MIFMFINSTAQIISDPDIKCRPIFISHNINESLFTHFFTTHRISYQNCLLEIPDTILLICRIIFSLKIYFTVPHACNTTKWNSMPIEAYISWEARFSG